MGGECVVFAVAVYGRGMRGICGVAGLRGDECSRRRRAGFAWYLRVGRRAGFAWYLRGTGGVWAGNAWYLRGGRPAKDERSRGRRVVFAGSDITETICTEVFFSSPP